MKVTRKVTVTTTLNARETHHIAEVLYSGMQYSSDHGLTEQYETAKRFREAITSEGAFYDGNPVGVSIPVNAKH